MGVPTSICCASACSFVPERFTQSETEPLDNRALHLWVQFASAGIVVMIDGCWYVIVACVFSLGPIAHGYTRLKKWIDYVTGGVLVVLGVRLAGSK